MKAGKLTGQIRAAVLAAAVFLSAMPFTAHYPVYAEEVTDEAAVAEEGAADAAAEGEAAADGAVEGVEGEVLIKRIKRQDLPIPELPMTKYLKR